VRIRELPGISNCGNRNAAFTRQGRCAALGCRLKAAFQEHWSVTRSSSAGIGLPPAIVAPQRRKGGVPGGRAWVPDMAGVR